MCHENDKHGIRGEVLCSSKTLPPFGRPLRLLQGNNCLTRRIGSELNYTVLCNLVKIIRIILFSCYLNTDRI